MISAAFEGFRIIGRRFWSFMGWWILAALFTGPLVAVKFIPGAEGQLRAFGGVNALELAMTLAQGTFLTAAVYRSVLRPEQSRFAYLRLSGDEARMLVVFAVAWGGAELALRAGALAGPLGWVVDLAAIAIATPLTLIGPQIFAERRFDLLGGLKLFKGWYGGLVTMNILTWILFRIFVAGLARLLSAQHELSVGAFEDHTTKLWVVTGFVLMVQTGMNVVITAPAAAAYRFRQGAPERVKATGGGLALGRNDETEEIWQARTIENRRP